MTGPMHSIIICLNSKNQLDGKDPRISIIIVMISVNKPVRSLWNVWFNHATILLRPGIHIFTLPAPTGDLSDGKTVWM